MNALKNQQRPILVWLRQDLRLADNPALSAAIERGVPVVPVYIWAPEEEGNWSLGGASKWWLHQSLEALEGSLRRAGSRLIFRTGSTSECLQALAAETGASAVLWNRRYEPAIRQRDSQIQEALRKAGLEAESFNAALLHEPWTIQNKSGKPFRVFTPFWRHCMSLPDPPPPLPAPQRISPPGRWPSRQCLDDLKLKPPLDWARGFREVWNPGEQGAAVRLEDFLDQAFEDYFEDRNRPDLPGTSRLSPHMHFGEISPRQVWHRLRQKAERQKRKGERSSQNAAADIGGWRQSQFVTEIGWREFSHHLLYHFPRTDAEPLREDFSRFRWRTNPEGLDAWQRGRTGFPIVDAGMRELWATGWMHNRVRMVVASFLVKDLLISWVEGARWFWDTLVDADLAQNTLGWQWTAGCGADAAPFFRIFNPFSQGAKFDPLGTYVRRWVPELSALPDEHIHQPAAASPAVLESAGVVLGRNYPFPIVNHTIAREVALEAFAKLKLGRGGDTR